MIQSPQMYTPQYSAYPQPVCPPQMHCCNSASVAQQLETLARYVQPSYSAVSIYNPAVNASPAIPYNQIPANAYSSALVQPQVPYQPYPLPPVQEPVAPVVVAPTPVVTTPEPTVPSKVDVTPVPVPPQDAEVKTPEEKPTVEETKVDENVAPKEEKAEQTTQETTQESPALDLSTAVAALKSDDIEKQAQTMENISTILEHTPDKGTEFIDTNVVNSLVDILNKDTSSLEGPTPRQTVLRQKLVDGQQLTPEEDAEAKQLSPIEAAERNKQYALYTLAMVQNALANELEKRGEKVPLNELPAIDNMIETATKNPNPMLRASAIAGLSYIAKPEYKDVLSTVFDTAKKDDDATVKEVAEFALNRLNTPEQPKTMTA